MADFSLVFSQAVERSNKKDRKTAIEAEFRSCLYRIPPGAQVVIGRTEPYPPGEQEPQT